MQPEDFYFNEQGLMVFTEAYHRKRGYCCGNNCLHCPFNHSNVKAKKNAHNPSAEMPKKNEKENKPH